MPGCQEARRKTPKKRVEFLMKTAVFEHPVKRYTHCVTRATSTHVEW